MTQEESPSEFSKLVRLTYVSNREQSVSDADIVELVERATSTNRAIGLTSCLYVSASRFLQVLEGPQELVETMYRRIGLDQRHQGVRLLGYVSAGRNFPRRSMTRVLEHDDPALDELVALYSNIDIPLPTNDEPAAVRAIIDRLKIVVQRHPEEQ